MEDHSERNWNRTVFFYYKETKYTRQLKNYKHTEITLQLTYENWSLSYRHRWKVRRMTSEPRKLNMTPLHSNHFYQVAKLFVWDWHQKIPYLQYIMITVTALNSLEMIENQNITQGAVYINLGASYSCGIVNYIEGTIITKRASSAYSTRLEYFLLLYSPCCYRNPKILRWIRKNYDLNHRF